MGPPRVKPSCCCCARGLHRLIARQSSQRCRRLFVLQQRPQPFRPHSRERVFYDNTAGDFHDVFGFVTALNAVPMTQHEIEAEHGGDLEPSELSV